MLDLCFDDREDESVVINTLSAVVSHAAQEVESDSGWDVKGLREITKIIMESGVVHPDRLPLTKSDLRVLVAGVQKKPQLQLIPGTAGNGATTRWKYSSRSSHNRPVSGKKRCPGN